MSTVIKVENLSKQYRLGLVNSGTIRDDLSRWWHSVRGKENPLLKIGETNDRTAKGLSNYVWSLKDINFEVKQGEVLGIIGRNGAGKSTLLKILSKVTAPTTGQIKTKGRIASLLEVGTGFHPELTGKENIYLNGAILGMRRAEITRKLDEIIAFAGVERYIDTPVKRYSSGMYVRLAFAVAAHLESEILIIDEVLAVGDAEFQKKCLGKMGEVSKSEGRTVLFVSHNMSAVKELCDRVVMLENGQLKEVGPTNEIITNYLSTPVELNSESDFLNDYESRRGGGEARFIDVKINGGAPVQDPSEEIKIDFKVKAIKAIPSLLFFMAIKGQESAYPFTTTSFESVKNSQIKEGEFVEFSIVIPKNVLRVGVFPLYLWIGRAEELAAENYHYDLIDGVFYLNLRTEKSFQEIGYDCIEPNGFFNFPFEITTNK